MRYAYRDLGQQPAGSTVIVRWRGASANVILLDPVNFSKYQYTDGRPFFYEGGGHYPRPPARLSIQEGGRWFVVVDRGSNAITAPTVEVIGPEDAQPEAGRGPERLATAERGI